MDAVTGVVEAGAEAVAVAEVAAAVDVGAVVGVGVYVVAVEFDEDVAGGVEVGCDVL